MPVRRHEPTFIPTRARKYDTHHDYGIEDSINRVDYLSNAVLQDTYEAAKSSRGKDHDLLRTVNAAIPPVATQKIPQSKNRSPSPSRKNTPVRSGRPTKRYQPLSQVDTKPISSVVVPYRNIEKIKSALLSSPSPTSLLSSRINSYLRGSSASPQSARDNFLYRTLLPSRSSSSDEVSQIKYRPNLLDLTSPSILSSNLSYEHLPRALTSSYRSTSPFYPTTSNNDYDNSENDEDSYESETDYRRKYKIITSPPGSPVGSGVRRIGEPVTTYSDSPESDDVEEDYSDNYGTYSCPRPSGTSQLKLSSYDGDYDGSYEADMAEMYDYIPFGPSRHGFLEFTEHEDNNRPSSYISSSALRSVSPPPSYISSSALRSVSPPPSYIASSALRSFSPPSSSLTNVSVFPKPSKYHDESLTHPYKSNTLLDSVVSSAAARARKVLEDSKLPDYKHASLLLSVEGSAVSEDGKNRYGFRYYPPPIPLKGSHIGLDERILGITPKSTSPADSFLSTYLNKLSGIRSDVRDHVERGDYARGRSVVPVSKRPTYSHSTVHLPVTIEGRAHSVPVSSYRSHLSDGQSHRVDVFPLVVSETTLPSDKKLHLPYFKADGDRSGSPNRLTVLEKINIKVSTEQHVNPRVSAVSRKVRASTAPPASRPLPGQQVQQQQYIQVAQPLTATQYPKGAIVIMLAPNSSYRYVNSNITASKPVVLSQAEAPWYLRARGGSVPPPDNRNVRAVSVPPRPRKAQPVYKAPEPLPTESLRAHRPVTVRSDFLRAVRARSLEPSRRPDYQVEKPPPSFIPSTQLWAHRPQVLRKDAVLLAKAKTQNRKSYPGSLATSTSGPFNYDKASDYYFTIPDVQERALSRYLYAHRGRFGPDSKPPRQSLGNFPQVYVPWKGSGPSNRSKAAIIGSRLDAADGSRVQRRPRSDYAANKLRELKREESEQEGSYYRTPSTSTLYASRSKLPKPTSRKGVTDVNVPTRPKNILSWEYRIESKLSPDDLIYEPSRFIRMREQVKDIQEKMNRQRQLLDRYLDSDFKIAPNPPLKSGENSTSGESNRPVSDFRRKLRRTIAKGKNDADYYGE